jgi:carotenoid 1,2-hydratase
MSDDGRYAISLIAMLGSVFSPFYARARATGGAIDPLEHSALNVSLYSPRAKVWSLNERGRREVHRDASSLTLGASSLHWERDTLVISLAERTTPFLPARVLGDERIVGTVRVHPRVRVDEPHALDGAGAHLWWSAAPLCRVEVELTHPNVRWSGEGYHDANAGDGPLEETFRAWDWSRATTPDGSVILYDAETLDGARALHGRRVTADGRVARVEAPRRASLARTVWGVERATRTDLGATAAVRETLEDAPFYARSVVDTKLLGHNVRAMHETLDLQRFQRSWVQFLLPFRTRRM